jgi:hypothetical protein
MVILCRFTPKNGLGLTNVLDTVTIVVILGMLRNSAKEDYRYILNSGGMASHVATKMSYGYLCILMNYRKCENGA